LNLASNLLSRLNASNPLTKLVVTLYPGDEGYTLSLSTQQQETELVRFSYEDTHVLDSVDNEELPVIVMDLLSEVEQDTQDLFHSGMVVCELRDLRKGPRGSRDLVLLRPTTQSIICDSIAMSRGAAHAKWTSEDRNNLESQVVLATEGPLCLDPSPVVSLIAAKAHHSRTKFSTVPLRRHATKRYSQAGQNRKRKLESLAAPPELALHDFIRNLNSATVSAAAGSGAPPGKRKLTPVEALRVHQESSVASARSAEASQPQSWTHGSLSLASPELRLAVPAQVDVQKFVRPIPKRPETSDMTPQLVEEYVLETAERGQARVYHTRLTILQRLANDEYIGELYVERDFREDDRKGSTCRFLLGTRTNALRYINQFTEIFTEEGRKNVKITHKVPNQQPRVTFTAGMRATMSAQASSAATPSSSAASPAPGAAATPQPQAAILQKKPQPASQQLQVSSMSTPTSSPAKVTMVSSGLPGSGTITVSSSSLGQVALQIQPPAKIGPGGQIQQIIQTSQGHQIVQQRVVGQSGQVVQTLQPGQIVQQVNSAGQVLHTLQAGQVVQMQSGQLVQQQQQQPQAAQIVQHAAQIVQQPSGQLIQQPIGQLTALVPTSIASKLPTAPLARPDLPQVTTLAQPAAPQQPGSQGKGENQQEAISAIVQSLMRAETQFEQKKKMEEQRKSLPSPGGVPISPGSVPQLPTVPVPQASLHGTVTQSKAMGRVSLSGLLSGTSQHQLVSSASQQHLAVSMASMQNQQQQLVTVSSSGQQQQVVYVNSLAGQQQQQQQLVTVSSMTTAQHQQLVAAAQQQQQLVTVNSMTAGQQHQMVMVSSNSGQTTHMVTVSAAQMSQLAAQLARPVQTSSSLPTYSQALRDSQSSEGRTSSLQTSPRRRPSEAPSPLTQLLPSPAGQQPLPSPSDGSGAASLSALLADTPAADKPLPPGTAGVANSNSNSLLERLVSGSHLGTSHSSHLQQTNSSSNLTPAASQLPSIHAQHHNSSSNVSNGSSEEITLQSLLSHPSKVPSSQSPTKHSPLLQQLQQPVQSGHQARLYQPQPGLTSPRQLPPSPRPMVTSPRPVQSPRHNHPPSPRPTSALQQQLMQPPAPRYPTATSQHSILSAHLTAPPRTTPHSPLLAGLVVSQPHHATSTQQVVSVSLSDLQSNMTNTSSVANGAVGQVVHTQQLSMVPGQVQQVQLVNQGSQHQVQLVSQAGGQHQVQLVNQAGIGQHQVQLVNQGSGQHQVQLVNQGTGQHQVQLVNQGTSGQHQVQLVNQAGAGQVQLVNQGQSGQMQLVNQVGGQGGQQIMVNNVPMQLSISHPVSFSVNLSEAQASSLANGVTQTPILVSGAGKTGSVTVTSMGNLSNLGKLVSNGPNGAPTTVLLQQQGGNILLPQQQQFISSKQGGVVRQQQVMVRPGQQSPVLVQLPSGQQLVRQVSINPNMNCNLVNQSVNKTVVASPSPSGPPTPGVPPSVTSPQATHTPDSPMVVQLNHQGDPVAHHSGPHFLLANQKAGLVNQPMGGQIMTGTINQAALNNQPHLKIRQQRKQSLK